MPNSTFLPRSDNKKSIWFKNFACKLPQYATELGLLPADITSVTNDSLMVSYSLEQIEFFKGEIAKRVAYKTILFDGEIGGVQSAYPTTTPPAAAPVTVGVGIFKRTTKLVQRIKNHSNYTNSMGKDLGIEGNNNTQSTLGLMPMLKILINAGQPRLSWIKGKSTATDLYVDRGDGNGFTFLATATVPKYTDTFKLPADVTSALWAYKAIYKIADILTGDFSNPVSITVKHLI